MLKGRFSTNISVYLRNGARQGHSCYGYAHYRMVQFAMTLSDPNYPKLLFSTFCVAFHIFVSCRDRNCTCDIASLTIASPSLWITKQSPQKGA